MADDQTDDKKDADDAEGKEEGKKSGSNLLLILIIVLLLLIIGAGAFLLFTQMGRDMIGIGQNPEEVKKVKMEELPPTDVTFFALPELLVNLTKSSPKQKKSPFLRLSLKLELPDKESEKTMQAVLPRIIDQFQIYLRQLRMEDIEGSQGLQRLREELLKRANDVSPSVEVRNVLFEVVLIQ